jgi:hypothetical protein
MQQRISIIGKHANQHLPIQHTHAQGIVQQLEALQGY